MRYLWFTQFAIYYKRSQVKAVTMHVETDRYMLLALKTGKAATWETQKLTELKIQLTERVWTQNGLNCIVSLVLYMNHATVMHTQVYSQLMHNWF
jgi:hypothetical protein